MPYKVDVSRSLLQRIRDLYQEAVEAGQGAAYAVALRQLFEELKTAPEKLGEIKYHTPHLRDPVHLVARGPLALNFVIHESPPAVWVIKVERLLAAHE